MGTTIYPGLQFTAVAIKDFILPNWSINDICVYIPVWFGVLASAIVGMITYECSQPAGTHSNLYQYVMDILNGKPTVHIATSQKSCLGLYSPAAECAIAACAMMAIAPAHLMRSMGGGYDNESIAVSAMVFTFWSWIRSLRAGDPHSHWFGILTGLAYFYMVAAW